MIKRLLMLVGVFGILVGSQVIPVSAGNGAPQPPTVIPYGQGFTVMYADASRPLRDDISSTWGQSGWIDSSITPFPGTNYTIPRHQYFASNIDIAKLADTEYMLEQASPGSGLWCHSASNPTVWSGLTSSPSLIFNNSLAIGTPGSTQGYGLDGAAHIFILLVDTSGYVYVTDLQDTNNCPTTINITSWNSFTTNYSLAAAPVSKGVGANVQAFAINANVTVEWATHELATTSYGAWTVIPNGVATSNPSVITLFNSDGSLLSERVYVRGTDNKLYEANRSSAYGTWSGWASLDGNITTGPGCASDGVSKVMCAAMGTNGHLYYRHVVYGQAWSGWLDMGLPQA